MISFDEYAALDGVAMGALVCSRQLTAAELLETAIARAEAVNPQLNAIVIDMLDYDLYMTPTIALPPPPVGERTTPIWAERAMRVGMPIGMSRLIPLASGTVLQAVVRNLERVPFTQLANVTGVPAMSVPLESFATGLPMGIHFLANHGGEGLLLALAGQLERAAPWHARRASRFAP